MKTEPDTSVALRHQETNTSQHNDPSLLSVPAPHDAEQQTPTTTTTTTTTSQPLPQNPSEEGMCGKIESTYANRISQQQQQQQQQQEHTISAHERVYANTDGFEQTDGHDGDDEEQSQRDRTGRKICAATLAIACPYCHARNQDPILGKLNIRKCGLRHGVQRWKCSVGVRVRVR